MKKLICGKKEYDIIVFIVTVISIVFLVFCIHYILSAPRCSSCDEILVQKGTTDGVNTYCDRCVSICMEEARIEQGKSMKKPYKMFDMDIYQRGLELLRERSR